MNNLTPLEERILKEYSETYQELIGNLVDSAIDVGSTVSNNPLVIDLSPIIKLTPEFVEARNQLKQFLLTSLRTVREETVEEINNHLFFEDGCSLLCISNEEWNKIVSLTHPSKPKLKVTPHRGEEKE